MLYDIKPMNDNTITEPLEEEEEVFEYDDEIIELAKKWGMPEQEILDLFQSWEDNNINGFYGLPWDDPDVPDEYTIGGGRFIDMFPDSMSGSYYVSEEEEAHINRFVENASEHYVDGPLNEPVIPPKVLSYIDCKAKQDLRKEKKEKVD